MRTLAILAVVAGLGLGSLAQASATATSSISPSGEVRATIGTFVFEPGQKLALEFTGGDPCPCACGTIVVTSFAVLGEDGAVIFADRTIPYPVPLKTWVGRWDLVTAEMEKVPEGRYIALVRTSLGEFGVELQVSAAGTGCLARSTEAEATICGIGLALYRLVDEDDDQATVTLCAGERLMIALPGNPTTGYGWEIDDEPLMLYRADGLDYRPSSGRIGSGGTFFFRYEAAKSGTGRLELAYRRAWEAVPPQQTFSIFVTVE